VSRVPIIAGNWKMNTLRADATALARDVRQRCDAIAGVEKIICPPYVWLADIAREVEGSSVKVGAQSAYWVDKGAFTGEVSITQVADVAEYVIIGHSERRQYFDETDETVNRRVKAALAHGVKPIMCVGETLAQREAGDTERVLVTQTRGGLEGVTIGEEFIIAYEPVWAIGTGLAADGPTAQTAIELIRRTIRESASAVADSVRILYGGSVTPGNVAEFMAQPDIDGGLIGGASLNADSFGALIDGAAASVSARA
jgi:triosephosphate isomerase